jgi:hypothetical protein
MKWRSMKAMSAHMSGGHTFPASSLSCSFCALSVLYGQLVPGSRHDLAMFEDSMDSGLLSEVRMRLRNAAKGQPRFCEKNIIYAVQN